MTCGRVGVRGGRAEVDPPAPELPWLIKQLPQDGLCFILSDKFIQTEAEFRAFIANNW